MQAWVLKDSSADSSSRLPIRNVLVGLMILLVHVSNPHPALVSSMSDLATSPTFACESDFASPLVILITRGDSIVLPISTVLHTFAALAPIVRGIHDVNGIEAWRRSSQRYSPNTPARTLVKLMDVLIPGKTKTAHALANKNCELKLNVPEKECLEQPSQKIKAAILLRMCMQELQHIIVRRIENVDEYVKVQEVVVLFIYNKK